MNYVLERIETLRDELHETQESLRGVKQLQCSVDALTLIVSDARDAVIRLARAGEDLARSIDALERRLASAVNPTT